MNHIGNPLGSDLDKAKSEPGEFVGNTVVYDRIKGAQHGKLELCESTFVLEHSSPIKAAIRRVNTYRHIQSARLFVKRIEIRVARQPVVIQASHVYSTRTV